MSISTQTVLDIPYKLKLKSEFNSIEVIKIISKGIIYKCVYWKETGC